MIDDRRCAPIEAIDLVAYIEGELSAEDSSIIEQHLADCERCQNEVYFLRTVQEAAMVPTDDPPVAVRESAYAIPTSNPQAQLDYDSATVGEEDGVRSTCMSDRTLRWRVDDLLIEVSIEQEGRQSVVSGQVSDPQEEPIAGVQIKIDTDVTPSTTTDELGYFTTTADEPRAFTVTVEKPGGVVVSDRERLALLASVDAG